MKRLEERLWKYEREAEVFLEELNFENVAQMITDFDELMMFRYKLEGEKVEEIDRKYLPQIYEAIVSHYPELKDYILRSFKSAGVDLSILQKTLV
jgi:DNA phosphorothioation-dependent restriction protein DptG